MADWKEQEKKMLRRAALRTIGHVLKHQPEFEQTHDAPDHMRELLAEIEKDEKPKTKRKKDRRRNDTMNEALVVLCP
jgi:hypothetical protein